MQRLKIDVKKIDKALLFAGAKGTYLDATLMDNREGTDQYGNDGFIVQDIGKERREAGEKGPIIGNWKHVGPKQSFGVTSPEYGKRETAKMHGSEPITPTPDDDDEIPF